MWTRRQDPDTSQSWIYQEMNYPKSNIAAGLNEKSISMQLPNLKESKDIFERKLDLRGIVKEKALKHRDFYRSLLHNANTNATSENGQKMAGNVSNQTNLSTGDHKEKCEHFKSTQTTEDLSIKSEGSLGHKYRQRKRGVYEISSIENSSQEAFVEFRSVKQLRQHYQAMLEKTYKDLSIDDKNYTPEKDKSPNLLLPPSSGYCSSSASGGSDDEKEKNSFGKGLRRSTSSDSAVHSDEESTNLSNWSEKRDDYSPVEGQ